MHPTNVLRRGARVDKFKPRHVVRAVCNVFVQSSDCSPSPVPLDLPLTLFQPSKITNSWPLLRYASMLPPLRHKRQTMCSGQAVTHRPVSTCTLPLESQKIYCSYLFAWLSSRAFYVTSVPPSGVVSAKSTRNQLCPKRLSHRAAHNLAPQCPDSNEPEQKSHVSSMMPHLVPVGRSSLMSASLAGRATIPSNSNYMCFDCYAKTTVVR